MIINSQSSLQVGWSATAADDDDTDDGDDDYGAKVTTQKPTIIIPLG